MEQPLSMTSETDTCNYAPHGPPHLQQNETPLLPQRLFNSQQYMSPPDMIIVTLTEGEYKGKIKAWDKATSTSPMSNMHLRQLKAYWAEHTLPPKSKEANKLDDARWKILAGHLTLLNYVLHFGHPYQRWTHIINTMLEKDPGTPKIHCL